MNNFHSFIPRLSRNGINHIDEDVCFRESVLQHFYLLANLLERNLCRRLTLMMERCPQETAQNLLAVGCEVQLFSGRVLGLDAEEEL